jgi:hypothetical protein
MCCPVMAKILPLNDPPSKERSPITYLNDDLENTYSSGDSGSDWAV